MSNTDPSYEEPAISKRALNLQYVQERKPQDFKGKFKTNIK